MATPLLRHSKQLTRQHAPLASFHMSSFLTLFCCCGHHRVRDEDSVDENSHLIPSNLESAPYVAFVKKKKVTS
jgi:hypothetical protein